ncbi:MAG: carbamoyl transferase [candidate division Zixibacteria bacterium]|nr:carbamoyl transferase [candidate division Zixibacteria bacterium]
MHNYDAIILGIGGSDHDFSSAIIKYGKVIVAIEDERITRTKYGRGQWYSIPTKPSLEYCLKAAEINLAKINYVFSNLHLEKRAFDQKIGKIINISHHLAHAGAAFYPSPFQEAAIVIIDGAGSRISCKPDVVELETISIGYGKHNKINIDTTQTGKRYIATCYWKYMASDSIGSFYQAITEIIGFGSRGAGKTMGIASYGTNKLYKQMKEFVQILPEGRFIFNPYDGIFDWATDKLNKASNHFMIRAELAAAAQKIHEEAVLNVMSYVKSKNKFVYLCFGGGSALNSVTNSKILDSSLFNKIYIFPATSDSGTSIGSALYGYYHYLENKRTPNNENGIGALAYTGTAYSKRSLLSTLNNYPVSYYKSSDLYTEVAWKLVNNEVIGWFQGCSEIGPRALGNRSILANPTSYKMRDHINLNIKLRESFRPLAPVVITDRYQEYFDTNFPSPYMLMVAPVKLKYRQKLAAITHVDGTSRLQTVDKSTNDKLYKLILAFEKLTGFPILLNTSFNIQGMPIVETPSQAVECFLKTQLDCLVMGDFIIEKHTPWNKRNVSS